MGRGRRPVARFPRTYYPVVRVPAGEGAPPAAGAGRGAPLPPPKPPAPRGPAADPTVRVRGIIRAVQSFKSGPVSSELLSTSC